MQPDDGARYRGLLRQDHLIVPVDSNNNRPSPADVPYAVSFSSRFSVSGYFFTSSSVAAPAPSSPVSAHGSTVPQSSRSRDAIRVLLTAIAHAAHHNPMQLANRQSVLEALRTHEATLRDAGVVRLSVFGSAVRNEARPDSDVDLLARFDDGRALSLLDVIRVQNQLSELLGRPVDLVEEGTLRPRVQARVEQEAVLAF